MRRLLAAGASPLPPDAWGRDPAAVARRLNRSGPLRLLEAATASRGGRKLVASGGVTSGAIPNGGCDSTSLPPPRPVKAGAGPCEGRGGEDEEQEDGAHVGVGKSDADGGGWSPKGSGGRGGGSRWVVMNESGRMLERASEKVPACPCLVVGGGGGEIGRRYGRWQDMEGKALCEMLGSLPLGESLVCCSS